ncbi:MAG: hypothetical protein CVV27_14910 [Candidatus Melainabacteria bacterium HGW-Melainabacteria-1]|nr:MAG: hypothetical protein CVV27_14910 [Candidatus Melainabacteria bacterium HGW-Melainabacteria-1]
MEALNFIEGSRPLEVTAPPAKAEPDAELLKDLQAWKPTKKTVQAEIEFLSQYFAAHGFERDRSRLAALEHYLAS